MAVGTMEGTFLRTEGVGCRIELRAKKVQVDRHAFQTIVAKAPPPEDQEP